MNRLISRIAQRLRGERFEVDPDVPGSYLSSLAVEKAVARLRGILIFRRLRPAVFVGRRARILCIERINISGYVSIGRDCTIDALSRDGIVLGHGFSMGRGASIECTGSLQTLGKGLKVGDNVGISSNSFLGCAGGIEIGSDTIIGNFVSMHSENHNFDRPDVPIRLQGVNHVGIRIGRNCWLGAKCTILDGVTLGDNSIVAAGAVVRAGEYEPWSLLAGVPARKIKSLI